MSVFRTTCFNDAETGSIAVYRAGLLGDTLVAIPALKCLRNRYPKAKIIYIWQKTRNNSHVAAPDVLGGAGLVDEFVCDDLSGSWLKRSISILRIRQTLKEHSVKIGIVLEEPHWPRRRKWLLSLCGVSMVLGPDGKGRRIERDPNGHLRRVKHISDSLIQIIAPLLENSPAPLSASAELPWEDAQNEDFNRKLDQLGIPLTNGRFIAIAPWSNMPLKRWPLENYIETVRTLVADSGVTPVVFGGPEEKVIAEKLIEACGCGYVVSGKLTISEGVGLLRRCELFLGNDTGTMHMAVAAGIRCVAIFSSRDTPGRWDPYGPGHKVFRTEINCAGCMLRECLTENMNCIRTIKSAPVIEACRSMLSAK